MTIALEKLVAEGENHDDAIIIFRPFGNLIRGPSDTGKSHIRDCLWYLLGGEKPPKEIPENSGYDTLLLQLRTSDGSEYTIRRGLNGGSTVVYPASIAEYQSTEALPDEIGTLLVSLAGAAGKMVLRSMAKRGPLTAGDLRHWSLISQPAMISESSTIGTPTEQPQRRASFSVFLTGKDDSSIVLAASKDDKLRIKSSIESIEADIRRVNADLPEGMTNSDTIEALSRVDETLTVLSSQQIHRSKQLRGIREQILRLSSVIGGLEAEHAYSAVMFSRFQMLDKKYESDFARLMSIGDGIAIFDAIDSRPCPLCRTEIANQSSELRLDPVATRKQISAMQAEAEKISSLRKGLLLAIEREFQKKDDLEKRLIELQGELIDIEHNENVALVAQREEFSVDPKTLAIRRSELYSIQKSFDEFNRLTTELTRLKAIVPAKAAPLQRQTVSDGLAVGKHVLELLRAWGLKEIKTIELDAIECDLKIDGRARLTYGAGMRSIFLTAMIVALLKHSVSNNYPHFGFVVLDSPMKSYSDPKNFAEATVLPSTVKDLFYSWLAKWNGPGQIIVLENESISAETALLLNPTEFTKSNVDGRYGFYPI